MKNIIISSISIIIFLMSVNVLNAQMKAKAKSPYEKGQINVHVGGSLVPINMKQTGLISKPVFGVDYGIGKKTTIGAFYIPTYHIMELQNGKLFESDKTTFGVRILGHLEKFKFWDIYGGFQLGYIATSNEVQVTQDIEKNKANMPTTYADAVVYSPVLGWKYQPVKSKFGAFVEFGFNGVAFGTVGISYRR